MTQKELPRRAADKLMVKSGIRGLQVRETPRLAMKESGGKKLARRGGHP
jgi:hypothetical protein